MRKDRRFPVLLSDRERWKHPRCPDSVPWAIVAPHAAQALKNHYQTLERLAERGGLSTTELMSVLHDSDYDAWVAANGGSERADDYAVTLLVAMAGIEAAT